MSNKIQITDLLYNPQDPIDKTVVGIVLGSRLGLLGALTGGVVGAFWDMMEGANPTASGDPPPDIPVHFPDNIPQTPIPIPDPPRDTPEIVIRKPPRKIFVDPPYDLPPPPPLPPRSLPVSTNTTTDVTSKVDSSLANHRFGCLLSRPIVDATYTLCRPDSSITFIDELIASQDALIQEIIDVINDKGQGAISNTAKSFILYALPTAERLTPIVGIQHIDLLYQWYWAKNAIINSFPDSGNIYTSYAITICGTPPVGVAPATPIGLNDSDNAECAVPITAFDELEGYKADQLQIIFRAKDDPKRTRSFTLPSPIDLLTITEDTFDILEDLRFGSTLIEIWCKLLNQPDAIRPIQKVQVYSDFKTKQECYDWVDGKFTDYLKALCKDVEVKNRFVMFLPEEEYWIGDCSPHRVNYMGWDKDFKHWCKKASWKV